MIRLLLILALVFVSTAGVAASDEMRLNLRSVHHADCGGCNEVPLGVGLHRLFGDRFFLDTGAGMFVDSHESYAGYVEVGGGVRLDAFLPLPPQIGLRAGAHRMVHWGAAGRHASDTEPVDYFSVSGTFAGVGVRYIRMPVVDVFQLIWEFN
ncbi:MAG: hypothetical protein KZQ99_02490 [Candidatus Thiodiazotropha sp. (ex Dulcina madagascariensis)]|nr:hypothetical protein [Candidatus Thiodiazotropha sp. (ex Dulcina madagascariensis)]